MLTAEVRNRRLAVAALIALSVLPVIWPLDTCFLNDEPVLVGLALQHNAEGKAAQFGLVGTRGARYGPVAVWSYQALLALTHDITALVQLHAWLWMSATAAALFALSRALAVPSAWAAIPLLSPYLWVYARMLWDNCSPISAVAFAAYAYFLARPRALMLSLALSALVACLMVHLMALALAVPIVVHLLLTRRSFLLSRAGLLAIVPALVVAAGGTRFWLALFSMDTSAISTQASGALWFASLGGRPLTAGGLDYFFGAAWSERFLGGGIGAAAMLLSMLLGHGLVWAGMARALWWLKRALADRTQRGVRVEIAMLALGIWAAQTVLNLVTQTAHHPHYYNATWLAFVVFAWLALDGLSRWRLSSYVAGAHALALAAALAIIVNGLHTTAGTRSLHYGLALREIMRVAAELGQSHPESRLASKVEQLRIFPQELMVLMWLAHIQPDRSRPLRGVKVEYASTDVTDAKLRVTTQFLSQSR
ncbi:MAG TPA: hypothetical protein VJV78_34180 [Polyangiales bacterium]|nr:hypothetical protein [Polyangiales bacterium]